MCAGDIGAISYWLLGYSDKAVAIGNDALALAERIAHPFSLLAALLSIRCYVSNAASHKWHCNGLRQARSYSLSNGSDLYLNHSCCAVPR